jgi:hypothetical protein
MSSDFIFGLTINRIGLVSWFIYSERPGAMERNAALPKYPNMQSSEVDLLIELITTSSAKLSFGRI